MINKSLIAAADAAPHATAGWFSAYGPSHLTVLVIFVMGSAALVWIGRRQTESQARLFGRVLAAIDAGDIRGGSGIQADPSLHRPFGAVATVRSRRAHGGLRLVVPPEVGVRARLFLGSTPELTGVDHPDLNAPDFPSHDFVTFFALHLLVVWAAIYLTWGYGMRPNWRSYRFAVTTTLAWGAFTLVFNTITGSDYGFLNRKPVNGSFLDLLGPWPSYVLAEVVIVGVVWALMTWPWE